MNTVFLSDNDVRGYLRDLCQRLANLKDEAPTVWCPIGPSGVIICQEAMQLDEAQAKKTTLLPVEFDRATGRASFGKNQTPGKYVRNKRVLLVDGSVHSGSTLLALHAAIAALAPREISSYSLVVRKGAAILPNFFGVMIGDHDRAHFLSDDYHNNRLLAFGCVRKLSDDDLDKPMIRSGERFIDKFSWSDHMYDGRVDPSRRTYVYERKGRIQGFVSFKLMARGSGLLIDEVAVDRRCQGSGIGGMLMRWAETCGRNEHCLNVQLWSAEDRKGWYGKMGYQLAGKEMTLDGVKFLLMTKKMLYNLPDDDVLTMGA